MPHLYNLVAQHATGSRTVVSDYPQPYPLAQLAKCNYIVGRSRKRGLPHEALTIEPAGISWVWIDHAPALMVAV